MTSELDPPDGPSLETRIERLEHALRELSAEMAAVRTEVEALSAPPMHARGSNVESPRARPGIGAARPGVRGAIGRGRYLGESLDLERLLGRYGMLGIAVLAAAAAVGTFLSWAISQGYLTLSPTARIVVGLAFAVAIAVWGIRLRRTERSFGSSLLGLSLVIVLVCAYAAGPGLAVVPEWFAFVGAMAVSWAMAIFARTEDDEPLWCVAFAGAAITPFVTSSGKGNLYGLVAYAASVLIAASFATGTRPWVIAWRVFYAAAALLVITGAVVSQGHGLTGFFVAFGLPIVSGVAGVLPFAASVRRRAALRWLWILVVATGFASPGGRAVALPGAIAFFAAAALWLTIADRLVGTEQSSIFAANIRWGARLDWIDAAIIPLALCFQSSNAIKPIGSTAIVYGAGAATFLAFVWRREASFARDAAASGFLVMAVTGIYALRLEFPAGVVIALVVLALVSLVLHEARPSIAWVAGSALVMGIAIATNAWVFLDRRPYILPPFATEASFTALAVAVALGLASRFQSRLADAMNVARSVRGAPVTAWDGDFGRLVVVVAPWAWVFLWGYLELSIAFSRSTSTLLLVIYFAACAVAGVAIGHTRQSAGARKAGLALALLAAGTAVYGATSFFEVGVRVLAYLVTSAFLLGIAYWYRRPGQMSGVADSVATPR